MINISFFCQPSFFFYLSWVPGWNQLRRINSFAVINRVLLILILMFITKIFLYWSIVLKAILSFITILVFFLISIDIVCFPMQLNLLIRRTKTLFSVSYFLNRFWANFKIECRIVVSLLEKVHNNFELPKFAILTTIINLQAFPIKMSSFILYFLGMRQWVRLLQEFIFELPIFNCHTDQNRLNILIFGLIFWGWGRPRTL